MGGGQSVVGGSKRVLLFAATTGYQIRSFGEAAEKVGVRLVFASDRCDRLEDPWWDGAIPVRFHEEESSLGTLRDAFSLGPLREPSRLQPEPTFSGVVTSGFSPTIDGVLAVGDRPTVLAARAAEMLGLPGNPPDAARASRDKRESHARLAAAGLAVANHRTVPLTTDARELAARLVYPVVIKPLALSGSRGVMRVDDGDGLVDAFARLRDIMASPDVRLERDAVHDHVLVEAFIPGREYAIEGVLDRGRFQPFAIFDKPDPMDGPFFEETLYVTPSRASQSTQSALLDAVARAAAALGLRHGPVHAECRVLPSGDDRHRPQVYVLEVAARPIGGLCARALRFEGGASLEEVLLRHAVGEDISRVTRERRASGVMMIPIPARGIFRGVSGEADAAAVPGIEAVHITAKRDALLVPLPEGRSYLGFIFARGEEPGEVERALRDAHARLRFAVEREVPVI